MRSLPELTVAAGLVRKFVEAAVAAGVAKEWMLLCGNLREEHLRIDDERLPQPSLLAVARCAATHIGDSSLPLKVGATVELSSFSVLGMLLSECRTPAQIIACFNRFGKLLAEAVFVGPGQFELRRQGSRTWLVDTRLDAGASPEMSEFTLSLLARILGPAARPPGGTAFAVSHRAFGHASAYRAVAPGGIVFEADWNAVEIDEKALDRRIEGSELYGCTLARGHAERLLHELSARRSTREQVERLIGPMLESGGVGIEVIAKRMRISRHTLFRQLSEEGVTFAEIVARMRQQLALDYLGRQRLSVGETARRLGFSEATAFSRAFKRWTGSTPRSAREPESIGVEPRNVRGNEDA